MRKIKNLLPVYFALFLTVAVFVIFITLPAPINNTGYWFVYENSSGYVSMGSDATKSPMFFSKILGTFFLLLLISGCVVNILGLTLKNNLFYIIGNSLSIVGSGLSIGFLIVVSQYLYKTRIIIAAVIVGIILLLSVLLFIKAIKQFDFKNSKTDYEKGLKSLTVLKKQGLISEKEFLEKVSLLADDDKK